MSIARALTAAVFALLLATGCGGAGHPPRLLTETVGSGPQTATIVRPDVDGQLPVVLFLHGWGATRPRFYRPWLEHLARDTESEVPLQLTCAADQRTQSCCDRLLLRGFQ